MYNKGLTDPTNEQALGLSVIFLNLFHLMRHTDVCRICGKKERKQN